MAASGLVTAWLPLEALAPGMAASREVEHPLEVRSCPRKDCPVVGTIAPGAEILVAAEEGDGALVACGSVVGYVSDRALLKPRRAHPPAALPPEHPAPYRPPAEPPRYLPPPEAPRYVPSDAPPVYVPPARPAARRDDPVDGTTVFVRRPRVAILAAPAPDAPVAGDALPGGAKLHVHGRKGEWLQVGTSPPEVAPAQGWVAGADVRGLPPLLHRVRDGKLSYRACPDRRSPACVPRALEGERVPSSVVSIDEKDDGALLLCIVPTAPGDPYVWVDSRDLDGRTTTSR